MIGLRAEKLYWIDTKLKVYKLMKMLTGYFAPAYAAAILDKEKIIMCR